MERENFDNYKDYPEGSVGKEIYDINSLTFDNYLEKYYSNPNLGEWNKWIHKYINPAFDKDRHDELIKNFGYTSIEKHDFKLQNETFNYLSNDNRLDDEVKKFIAFMAGAGFFKQNNLSLKEWFNINNWSNPNLVNIKSKNINSILSFPYGINCFKINLILMPFWRR